VKVMCIFPVCLPGIVPIYRDSLSLPVKNIEHRKDKNGLLRHILINVIKKVHVTKLKLGPQI